MLSKVFLYVLSCAFICSLAHDVKATDPTEGERPSQARKRNKVLKGTRAPHTSFAPGVISEPLEQPKAKKSRKGAKVSGSPERLIERIDTTQAITLLSALDEIGKEISASPSPASSSPAKRRKVKPSDDAGKTSPTAKKSGKKSAPKQPRSRVPETHDVPLDALQATSSAPQALPTSSQKDALSLLLPSSFAPNRREITTLDVATAMPSSSTSSNKLNSDDKYELYWLATDAHHPRVPKLTPSSTIIAPHEFYPVQLALMVGAGKKQVKEKSLVTQEEITITKPKYVYDSEIRALAALKSISSPGGIELLRKILCIDELFKDPEVQEILPRIMEKDGSPFTEGDMRNFQTHYGQSTLRLQMIHWKLTHLRLERIEADPKLSTFGDKFDASLAQYVFWKYTKPKDGPMTREQIPNLAITVAFSALKKEPS